MKITNALALLVYLAPATVLAAPANSCSRQAKCIDITTEKITTGLTCGSGTCEYKICVEILRGGSCVKSDSWSHSCIKPVDQCTSGSGFSGALEKTSGVTAGYEQCQIVSAGKTAEFLLKDGSGCTDNARFGDASCEPRASSTSSCTGNGVGKECIWTISAPSDCGGVVESGGDSGGGGESGGDSTTGDGETRVGDNAEADGEEDELCE